MEFDNYSHMFHLPTDHSSNPKAVEVCLPSITNDKKIILIYGYGLRSTFTIQNENYRRLPQILTKDYGLGFVLFDYRGAGGGEDFYHSSLMTRYDDMLVVIRDIHQRFPDYRILIGGHSAGGAIVARLSNRTEINNLIDGVIVSAPAAYSPRAWGVPFGTQFKKILNTKDSWKDSHEFYCFGKFQKPKVVISCLGDTVVGELGIVDQYHNTAGERLICRTLSEEPIGHKIFGGEGEFEKYRGKTLAFAHLLGATIRENH
jgi:pimeloyl-ACP methyl ester carboxylesterase